MEGIWGLQTGLPFGHSCFQLFPFIFHFFLTFAPFLFDLNRMTILVEFTVCLSVLAGIPSSDLNFVSCSNHTCASFILSFRYLHWRISVASRLPSPAFSPKTFQTGQTPIEIRGPTIVLFPPHHHHHGRLCMRCVGVRELTSYFFLFLFLSPHPILGGGGLLASVKIG